MALRLAETRRLSVYRKWRTAVGCGRLSGKVRVGGNAMHGRVEISILVGTGGSIVYRGEGRDVPSVDKGRLDGTERKGQRASPPAVRDRGGGRWGGPTAGDDAGVSNRVWRKGVFCCAHVGIMVGHGHGCSCVLRCTYRMQKCSMNVINACRDEGEDED